MIDTIITFLAGAWFGALATIFTLALLSRGGQMKQCLINDCTGFVGIAPCCLDCPERTACPDRCPKTNTVYCVGVIEHDENKSRALKEEPAVH